MHANSQSVLACCHPNHACQEVSDLEMLLQNEHWLAGYVFEEMHLVRVFHACDVWGLLQKNGSIILVG